MISNILQPDIVAEICYPVNKPSHWLQAFTMITIRIKISYQHNLVLFTCDPRENIANTFIVRRNNHETRTRVKSWDEESIFSMCRVQSENQRKVERTPSRSTPKMSNPQSNSRVGSFIKYLDYFHEETWFNRQHLVQYIRCIWTSSLFSMSQVKKSKTSVQLILIPKWDET